MQIGLATLRRDGFGYLSCKQQGLGGHFVSTTVEKPLPGARLLVNVDGLTKNSPLTVELVDEFDRPLPDYSGANRAVVVGSGTRREVTWPRAKDNLLPADRPFAIKVGLPATGHVRFYALYMAN